MSEEAHPNINAAGLTADVVGSIARHLRGDAGKDVPKSISSVKEMVLLFINSVSTQLDTSFSEEGLVE